jgi:hypothetical protein
MHKIILQFYKDGEKVGKEIKIANDKECSVYVDKYIKEFKVDGYVKKSKDSTGYGVTYIDLNLVKNKKRK